MPKNILSGQNYLICSRDILYRSRGKIFDDQLNSVNRVRRQPLPGYSNSKYIVALGSTSFVKNYNSLRDVNFLRAIRACANFPTLPKT